MKPLLQRFALTLALLGTLGSVVAEAAANPSARLRYFEKARQLTATLPDAAAHEQVAFEAFGRRYVVELEPNTRVARALRPSTAATVKPLRGTVQGAPNSWVRLTRTPRGLSGMIFDGQELYAVESGEDVAASGATSTPVATTDTVMYRLADLEVDSTQATCGLETPLSAQANLTAADVFEAVSAELTTAAATLPTKQIVVGAMADYEMYQAAGSNSAQVESYIAARMNVVDGIFSSQLGVRISLASPITVFTTSGDPFTTTDAEDLLNEVSTYRQGNATQRTYGLTHLFTGRNLDGSTVGIAFLGSICTSRGSTSLSEARQSATLVALVAAHEIGHNFGAPHDGEAACAATPTTTYLMAPQLNGSQQFSQCSIEQMQPLALGGSCLTPVAFADVDLALPATSVRHGAGEAFSYTLNVRSIGGSAATGVAVAFTIPAGVTLNSVNAAGGSCTSGAGTAQCTLGDLASGVNRSVTLGLTGTALGTVTLAIQASATNDAMPGNNSANVSVITDPVADLVTTLSASPGTFAVGSGGEILAGATNAGQGSADDVRLSIDIPAGLTVSGVTAQGTTCTTPSANSVSCGPTALATGAMMSATVTVQATTGGSKTVTAVALSSALDANNANNSASVSIGVTGGTTPNAASGGGGGGGGRFGWLAVAVLAAFLVFRGIRAMRARAAKK